MFFLGPVMFGIFLGVLASRAARWRRFHHGFRGGCGRIGHGPWGFGGPFGWRHGHGGPRQFFWMIRELGLSGAQVSELKTAWLQGRGAIASVRASGVEAAHAVLDAAFAEPFDRARVEDAARKHADEHGQAARDLAEAVSKAIEILTPEQRQKLRERFGRFGAGFGAERGPMGPDQGPYRSGGTFI